MRQYQRPRRNRKNQAIRDLVAETQHVSDYLSCFCLRRKKP
jgi:delta-aminolevulinic acid dehydratase/porphobilinogen synthase